MHDELAMRIGDRVADSDHQLQAPFESEPMLGAIVRQRQTLDILHREPWTPCRVDVAVDQACDARMLQTREDAPLRQETRDGSIRGEFTPNDFQCDFLLVVARNPVGEEHATHAAASQLAHDPPWTDECGHGFDIVCRKDAITPTRNIGDKVAVAGIDGKQLQQARM